MQSTEHCCTPKHSIETMHLKWLKSGKSCKIIHSGMLVSTRVETAKSHPTSLLCQEISRTMRAWARLQRRAPAFGTHLPDYWWSSSCFHWGGFECSDRSKPRYLRASLRSFPWWGTVGRHCLYSSPGPAAGRSGTSGCRRSGGRHRWRSRIRRLGHGGEPSFGLPI